MNLVESITKATDYLERHRVVSPRLNAERILAHITGLDRVGMYANSERPLSKREAGQFRLLLSRRARGYPLQYITGEVGFMGLTLEVKPGVFIPRPETEVLVEKVLEVLRGGEARVLDIGTGCGNIAVGLAVRSPSRIVATDIDWVALELCSKNASRAGVGNRVEVLQGDLYKALDGTGGSRFDVVVSNPPYIPIAAWEELPPEVRDFEPVAALFGGVDGLDHVRRIADGAPDHLEEGGWLALEVDESHAWTVVEELDASGWWAEAHCFEDLSGKPRVVLAQALAAR